MAAILLEVGGVFHVSGRALPGGAGAVRKLRDAGHRLRFVSNTTTLSRAQLVEVLRSMGLELDDGEVQTPAQAAARALAGKRVLALTMHAILDDLEGIEPVGEGADAVLVGGADETEESNRVFSFMNLARAWNELQAGADLYCLHRSRWWQTERGPLPDAGLYVAGLEYASGVDATVLGKPSGSYFELALEALDADAELAWMVSDDLETDIRGAQRYGLKTVLVRTGKFRPDQLDHSEVVPDAIVNTVADLPDWLERMTA